MGDRTYVSVYVLNEQAEQARSILTEGYSEPEDEDSHSLLTCFGFSEVNYARLTCENALTEAGIAWDKHWDSGVGYGAGNEHVRFLPSGELQHLEIYDDSESPPIHGLLKLLDKPVELVQLIKDWHQDTTPLPWDNQVEYGKVHRARLLIS